MNFNYTMAIIKREIEEVESAKANFVQKIGDSSSPDYIYYCKEIARCEHMAHELKIALNILKGASTNES